MFFVFFFAFTGTFQNTFILNSYKLSVVLTCEECNYAFLLINTYKYTFKLISYFLVIDF